MRISPFSGGGPLHPARHSTFKQCAQLNKINFILFESLPTGR
jgi:hypothetical protein